MKNTQMIFERHEKKYMLTMTQYHQLRERLSQYTQQDAHGVHTVSSVYYDTDSYQLIRTSIQKPVYKEKLRLRAYGTPTMESPVYLELKKKLDGIVYKRRIELPLREALLYLDHGVLPERQDQIFQEINWFVNRHRPRAATMLACERLALSGTEDPDLRITFDRSLRWRDHDLNLARGSYGTPLISPEQCLMEIKVPAAIPLWLSGILSSLAIYPKSFSKYGTCYQEHLCREGIRHAG